MLINSELPLTQLHRNLELNEYDFVLFHLYEKFPEYKKYYQELRQTHPERLMIFDNSAYEYFIQDKELDLHAFAEAIMELKPNYYILPDVLMDQKKTLSGVNEFLCKYAPGLSGISQSLAVAQGNTPQELFNCLLKYFEWDIKAVALPFHNSFYINYALTQAEKIVDDWKDIFGTITKDMYYAIGRIQFVKDIRYMLNEFEHIHLLGSHNPYEKVYYSNVDTMDTGYPVKCAIMGYELFKENSKPDIIIDDFMTKELTPSQRALIDTNINIFKNL